MSAPVIQQRTLQPPAWRRAVGPMVVAVLVLSVLLQEPVAALLPAETPRWLLFVVIAAPLVAAIVIGLSIAYPRVTVDADGALRVRGRRVAPSDVVGVRRSVSSNASAGYLVYTLDTASGRTVRVLVAGFPIRGLAAAELAVLREVIAASAIPLGADAAELERSYLAANLLATGRRVEADRRLVLRELDELLGVRHRPDAAPAAEVEVAEPAAAGDEAATGEPGAASALDDDLAAEQLLGVARARTRLLRRIALAVFVLACLVAAVLLIVLVVMESLGTDFGAADEDPLTATMTFAILAALVAGILWAVAADVDDARCRAVSREWLASASAEELARGLPAPFHAAWTRAPGGRMAGLALLVLGMAALFAVIGGAVAIVDSNGPVVVGVGAVVVGLVLGALALWAWFARRRAYARRVEWLLEVAGARMHETDDPLAG